MLSLQVQENQGPSMTTQGERLEDALARCIEASETGSTDRLEEVLAAFPELEGQLRDSMARLSRLGLCDSVTEAQERAIPERLGDYRLVAPLGGGGMGLVFRAKSVCAAGTSGGEVALKLIRPEQACLPRARARFRREVEAVSRLDHPAIVPLLDEGEDQGISFLVMELVRGCTLAEALDELKGQDPSSLTGADLARAVAICTARNHPGERSSERRTKEARLFAGTWMEVSVNVIERACRALEHVHRHGLVHRDVKPSNLLLTPEGDVLLFDFGLTHVQDMSRMTRTGSPMGSPAYMAPELIEGKGADERSDVYGLGITFYEMLTLHLPFEAASIAALESRILDASCRPPRHWNPAIPRDLEIISLHAMEVDPTHRYGDMAAWIQDLELYRASKPIRARPLGVWNRLQRWARRRPALAATLSGLLLFVVGTPTSLWLLQRQANQTLAGARDRAEKNLQMALSAVQDLLEVGGGEAIQDRPALQGTGKKLVERAARLYSEYLESTKGEPRVARARARIGLVLGDLLLREGDLAGAGRSARQAQDDLSIAGEGPGNRELRIRADLLLARVYRKQRKLGEAERLLAGCRLQLDEAATGSSWFPLSAQVWSEQGGLELDRGLAAKAEAAYGKALEQLQALKDPTPDQKAQLAETWIRWGQVAAQQQKRDLALERYQRSVTLHRDLLESDPESFLLRINLARSLLLQASMEARLGRPVDGGQHYREATDVLRHLIAEQPRYPDLRVMLADILSRSARLDHDMGEGAQVDQKFREAEGLFEQLWTEAPGLPSLATAWVAHIARRSSLLLRDGREDEAMRTLALAKELPDPDLAHANLSDIDKFCRVLRNVATLARIRKKWDQAERSFERVIALRRWVLQRVPDEPGFKISLAFALNNQGHLYLDTNRKGEAMKVLREAIRLKREVLALTPGSAPRTYSLALSLHNLAGLEIEASRKRRASVLLKEAVELLDRALGMQDQKRFRVRLCNALEAYALLQADLGDPSRLRDTARRIGELLPERSSTPYRNAILICRYLELEGTGLEPAVKTGLEKQVVDSLARAIERKRIVRKNVFEDARFAVVRGTEAFDGRFGKKNPPHK